MDSVNSNDPDRTESTDDLNESVEENNSMPRPPSHGQGATVRGDENILSTTDKFVSSETESVNLPNNHIVTISDNASLPLENVVSNEKSITESTTNSSGEGMVRGGGPAAGIVVMKSSNDDRQTIMVHNGTETIFPYPHHPSLMHPNSSMIVTDTGSSSSSSMVHHHHPYLPPPQHHHHHPFPFYIQAPGGSGVVPPTTHTTTITSGGGSVLSHDPNVVHMNSGGHGNTTTHSTTPDGMVSNHNNNNSSSNNDYVPVTIWVPKQQATATGAYPSATTNSNSSNGSGGTGNNSNQTMFPGGGGYPVPASYHTMVQSSNIHASSSSMVQYNPQSTSSVAPTVPFPTLFVHQPEQRITATVIPSSHGRTDDTTNNSNSNNGGKVSNIPQNVTNSKESNVHETNGSSQHRSTVTVLNSPVSSSNLPSNYNPQRVYTSQQQTTSGVPPQQFAMVPSYPTTMIDNNVNNNNNNNNSNRTTTVYSMVSPGAYPNVTTVPQNVMYPSNGPQQVLPSQQMNQVVYYHPQSIPPYGYPTVIPPNYAVPNPSMYFSMNNNNQHPLYHTVMPNDISMASMPPQVSYQMLSNNHGPNGPKPGYPVSSSSFEETTKTSNDRQTKRNRKSGHGKDAEITNSNYHAGLQSSSSSSSYPLSNMDGSPSLTNSQGGVGIVPERKGLFVPKEFTQGSSKYSCIYLNEGRWAVCIHGKKRRFRTRLEADAYYEYLCAQKQKGPVHRQGYHTSLDGVYHQEIMEEARHVYHNPPQYIIQLCDGRLVQLREPYMTHNANGGAKTPTDTGTNVANGTKLVPGTHIHNSSASTEPINTVNRTVPLNLDQSNMTEFISSTHSSSSSSSGSNNQSQSKRKRDAMDATNSGSPSGLSVSMDRFRSVPKVNTTSTLFVRTVVPVQPMIPVPAEPIKNHKKRAVSKPLLSKSGNNNDAAKIIPPAGSTPTIVSNILSVNNSATNINGPSSVIQGPSLYFAVAETVPITTTTILLNTQGDTVRIVNNNNNNLPPPSINDTSVTHISASTVSGTNNNVAIKDTDTTTTVTDKNDNTNDDNDLDIEEDWTTTSNGDDNMMDSSSSSSSSKL